MLEHKKSYLNYLLRKHLCLTWILMSTDQPTKICQKIVEWAIFADALNLRIFQNHVTLHIYYSCSFL